MVLTNRYRMLTSYSEENDIEELDYKIRIAMNTELVEIVRTLMENEARSCSMDFGCVDAKYVQRMLGGVYSIEEIEAALKTVKKELGLK